MKRHSKNTQIKNVREKVLRKCIRQVINAAMLFFWIWCCL